MPTRASGSTSKRLHRVVEGLRTQHGRVEPPPASDAFALVLWEKVGYLAPDDRRLAAFEMLRQQVGLTPHDILDADPDLLRTIAEIGGRMEAEKRAQRMRDAATLVIDEFDGSLDAALQLPLPQAKRALQRIYGIGEPGGEKILLLLRAHRVLALDSNGVRTLVRIGYGADHKTYSTMYRSVREATASEVVDDFDWLIDAHLLLRRHGQEVCKTSVPLCEMCHVRTLCRYDGARGSR